MNWNRFQWWVKLPLRQQLISALALALIVVSGVLWRKIVTDEKEHKQSLEDCNKGKQDIVEKWKDQVIGLQTKNDSLRERELDRLRDQKAYQDSVNYMILITQRKAEKVLKNAK